MLACIIQVSDHKDGVQPVATRLKFRSSRKLETSVNNAEKRFSRISDARAQIKQ